MRFAKKRRHRGATPLRREAPPEPRQWKAAWGPPLRWLGVALVLAGVGWGLWVGSQKLQDPRAFPLRHVRIDGELRNLAKADLEPVADETLGQNAEETTTRAVGVWLTSSPIESMAASVPALTVGK